MKIFEVRIFANNKKEDGMLQGHLRFFEVMAESKKQVIEYLKTAQWDLSYLEIKLKDEFSKILTIQEFIKKNRGEEKFQKIVKSI